MTLEKRVELYCTVCRDYETHEYVADWKTGIKEVDYEDLLMYNCKVCGDSRVVTRARVDTDYKITCHI